MHELADKKKKKSHHTVFLSQINFIMLHDELPPVQHPIHCTLKKKSQRERKFTYQEFQFDETENWTIEMLSEYKRLVDIVYA